MRVLYIVYWGATEPLGIAGTVPAVAELVKHHGEEVCLVTFDKPADYASEERREAVRRLLGERVRWFNLTYHKMPRNWSTLYDMAKGIAFCTYLVLRYRIQVVHGRTYVGALMGAAIHNLLRVPFVCHPDGFWPEERIDDGIWSASSRSFLVARALHQWAYRSADAIIVLSERARQRLLSDTTIVEKGADIAVLHTSVRMERFFRAPPEPHSTFRLVYLGSLGGRYMSAELFRFFACADEVISGLRIRIVTRVAESLVHGWAKEAGIALSKIEIVRAEPDGVPAQLADQDAAVFFLKRGLSNFATSATKVGEYLAAGLPVALTPECGDLDTLVQETRTGVVVESFDADGYRKAAIMLRELAADPAARDRCRATAERHMGLESAAARQAESHRAALEALSARTRQTLRNHT